MEKKLGRNDKCHCGSGKKYKKCCMEKDLQEEREARAPQPSEEELLFETEAAAFQAPGTHVWGQTEPEYFEEMDADPKPDKPSKADADRSVFKVPEISDEQDKLITDFLDRFYNLTDPKARAETLNNFLNDHPELAPNLAAESEALLELKDSFMRQELYCEYIEELFFLRKNYPQAYIQVFNYLDVDIVFYLYMNDQSAEIDNYLDLFRKYPTEDPDSLDSILNFLMCQGMFAEAHQLAQDIYRPIINDSGTHWLSFLQILTMGCFAPYLDAALKDERTEQSTRRLVQCLKPFRNYLEEHWFKAGFHEFLVKMILTNPETKLPLQHCQTRDEVIERYNDILFGFMGFLGREKAMHWAVADHFRLLLSDFFEALIPEGKIPKQGLPLTKNTITKALNKMGSPIFGIQASSLLGILSALYYLADYLVQAGSIGEDQGKELQDLTRQLHEESFSAGPVIEMEALALQRFPLF